MTVEISEHSGIRSRPHPSQKGLPHVGAPPGGWGPGAAMKTEPKASRAGGA